MPFARVCVCVGGGGLNRREYTRERERMKEFRMDELRDNGRTVFVRSRSM